jgi:hypothetical protein
MNKNLIQKNVEIAIGLLGSSFPNRYGNHKISHSHRNYITQTVTELLELILIEIGESDVLSIPKSPSNINLPEET